MNDYIFIESTLVSLFKCAEIEENRSIPPSIESIRECLLHKKSVVDKLLSGVTDEEEIDLLYELFQYVVLLEVDKLTWQMDKDGLLESGVNEKGEICYTVTEKGKLLL